MKRAKNGFLQEYNYSSDCFSIDCTQSTHIYFSDLIQGVLSKYGNL